MEVLKLDNNFTDRSGPYEVVIVGCGGTGSFVAEGLSRILPRKAHPVLIDMDIVQEENLIRQNFYPEDLGKMKSEVLAKRLSQKYQRPVGYSVEPVGMFEVHYPKPMYSFGQSFAQVIDIPIVIGCVDTGPARHDIYQMLKKHKSNQVFGTWYIDSGNGENFGQVLVGNDDGSNKFMESLDGQRSKKDICYRLPYPTIQRPDLLQQQLQVRNCEDAPEQGPTINQSMAVLVVEFVRRLIIGTCSWIQLYLDMEAGTMTPVYTTPENIDTILKQAKMVK